MDPATAHVVCALAETEEGRRTFAAMEDERQEACIHCGAVWYAIHHKDGVCHRCQAKKLPCLGQLKRRRKWLHRLGTCLQLLLFIVMLALIYTFLPG